MDLNSLVQEKIDADVDFQATLVALPEEEREQVLSTKRSEVLSSEFANLRTKADEADKLKELADNYKVRAEKAERERNQTRNDDRMPEKDLLYIAKSDIHQDDLEEVLEWAKFKKVSVPEAHKMLKATLDIRSEERRTAEGSNVTNARRSSAKISEETLIEKATAGDLPENDGDIERLISAKMKRK